MKCGALNYKDCVDLIVMTVYFRSFESFTKPIEDNWSGRTIIVDYFGS